jgi:hypothetical protein
MSTIFDDKIEINGFQFRRLNMVEGMQLQKKIIGLASGMQIGDNSTEEEAGKQIFAIIFDNFEFIIEIIKQFTGKTDEEIAEMEAGSEYDIILSLEKHPDVMRIIEGIKKIMGKFQAKPTAKKK